MILIPGPASVRLGHKIAEVLGTTFVPVECKRFPDGEYYIRIDADLENEEVVIVQTTSPPQNENLIQLFLIAGNANDLRARTITAVVPYFAYARQDKLFRPGEAFSIKTVVSLLEACGVDRIIAVNSHNPTTLKSFRLNFVDLSAVGLLAQYLKNRGFDGAFSLSVGKKAVDVAKQADKVLEGGYGYVPTQRDRVTGRVTIERKSLPVTNRDVIIFDDIISSGGTMVETVKWVKKSGPRRIYVACVHPLLVGDAMGRILRGGADGIVGTDCVPSPVSVVSVAPLIADALAKRGA